LPVIEHLPVSTTVVAAGWNNPTRCYLFNNTYANSTTNNAEQTYDYNAFSPRPLGGQEVLDKVFVKLEYYYLLTGVAVGDDATLTFSVKVYDGSSWTTYQITKNTFACTTVSDESFTDTIGDNSNSTMYLDVTGKLNTMAKLNSAQTRLLTTLTADAGLTPNVYVDAVSLVACYHTPYSVMATRGTATTRRSYPKAKRALQTVEDYLTV
jgi:hypothetical protein